MLIETGDNVGIGGFIITGTAPKQVVIRALGGSLVLPNALADPVLELHGPPGFTTIVNDNWMDPPNPTPPPGFPPLTNLESMIVVTLDPGAYTPIVSGKNNTSGIALLEVYDLDPAAASKLANLSTRAIVDTSASIVIAGFILGQNSGDDKVVVRGLGPSLAAAGVPNALANPMLELRDSNGALVLADNDWQDDAVQAAALTAAGLAPANTLESGIVATLPPAHTALLSG